MNWITKLERKFGRYCIPNLISILIGGQILVYAVELFVNQYISFYLNLDRGALLAGQIWRVITFMFVPFSGGGPLSVVLGIYFTWFIGTALEKEWGDFRFNLYLLLGMLGAVLACLCTGWADTYCLSLSLLLAFAMLYPEVQVLLFFVIPVRVKYFGLFAAALWVFSFLTAAPLGKLNYLLCMVGFAAFFGPQAARSVRAWIRREQWKLKKSVRMMLDSRRMTHSLLLVGEEGLGAGFAARCVAADYLYPAGGAPAEALLRGECCRAVGKPGDRDSGRVETGIVREAISITGMGSGGRYLVSQVKAMRTEIFNTSLSAEGRAVLLYHVERMNEESANALLKVMEEPPEGVLFIMTADSLAGVLPTIRSRCISFAVAPVSPEACARYCTARGVEKKDAALYSELFDGHIGTVLAAARDEDRRALVEQALTLAKAAQARDSYAAAVLLAGYEKDKAGATALLADFRAAAAAGVQGSKHSPVQGETARKALGLADTAIWHLSTQVNPKITLSVLAAKFRTL